MPSSPITCITNDVKKDGISYIPNSIGNGAWYNSQNVGTHI